MKKFSFLLFFMTFFFTACVEQKVTVTFNANGATEGNTFSNTVIIGESLTLPENPFSYNGYIFDGWSPNRNGSPLYQPQKKIQITGETVFFAIWKPRSLCTLYFDPNGGTGKMDPVKGYPNSEIRLPKCTFTKDGGLFHGWTTTPDGGKVAGDESIWTFKEKETTLYALYTKPGVEYVTVTFHSPESTDTTPQQKIEKDKETPLAANSFKNPGYEFKGWSVTESPLTVKYTDKQQVTLFADLDLYAVWEKEKTPQPPTGTGVLFFEANGGQGTMEPITGLQDGQTITLPQNRFTNENKVFIGWTFTKGSDTPDYQDMSPVYTYFSGTSRLYALWTDKKETIKISFDPNGGSGSVDSFYVKSGQPVSIPPNNFAPPEGKEYFTCTSYGLSQDDYSRYKVGSIVNFTEDTLLYAYWTPPSDPSIGGASEKYKGQTVFVEGVNINPEDWVQTSDKPLKKFAEWKPGCGWYDTDQDWLNYCWAASISNIIHWWLDRNKEYVDEYVKTHPEVPVEDFGYEGKGVSHIFTRLFVNIWQENRGWSPVAAFTWFIKDDEHDWVWPTAKGKGAFFQDVFGKDVLLHESLKSLDRRSFNTFVAEALEQGKIIGMSEYNMSGSHATTCWGFDFDEEGYICGMYYTDSATSWKNNSIYGKELSLGRINIKYDSKWKPYMETETLISGEVQYGRVEIVDIQSYSQGTEYWKAYFAAQNKNK